MAQQCLQQLGTAGGEAVGLGLGLHREPCALDGGSSEGHLCLRLRVSRQLSNVSVLADGSGGDGWGGIGLRTLQTAESPQRAISIVGIPLRWPQPQPPAVRTLMRPGVLHGLGCVAGAAWQTCSQQTAC